MTELIVALDGAPGIETRAMISRLQAEAGVRWFKVGVPMLLHPEGYRTADFIRWRGASMMLDLKLYDTRDTVVRAMEAAVAIGATRMVTVHDDSAVHAIGRGLTILAVRALTDGTEDGVPNTTGVDGIVCPVATAGRIRSKTGKLLVCPGIRPLGSMRHNHLAPATPSEAREAGADYIVVGRPIYAAIDPVAAARSIMGELQP